MYSHEHVPGAVALVHFYMPLLSSQLLLNMFLLMLSAVISHSKCSTCLMVKKKKILRTQATRHQQLSLPYQSVNR